MTLKYSDFEKDIKQLLATNPIPFYQLDDNMIKKLQDYNNVITKKYSETEFNYSQQIATINQIIAESLQKLKDAINDLDTQ